MNIFKVLSDGDGQILEPNVSALLAFLLDPKQVHGLNSAFLERIAFVAISGHPNPKVASTLITKDRLISLDLKSEYEVEVDTEVPVGLNEKSKRRDIDIVIEIFKVSEGKDPGGRTGQREFVHAIGIENKTRDAAIEDGQLLEEFEGLTNHYEEEKKVPTTGITMVFLTPTFSEKSNAAFEKFETALDKRGKACHLVWKSVEKSNDKLQEPSDRSISHHISELIRMDRKGEIDPIHEHTKYIIKSFLSFVRGDFKSYQDGRRNTGGKDYTKYSFNGGIYSKARLPLAVITEYIRRENPRFEDLKEKFPDSLMTKWKFKGLICLEDVAREISNGRRYFYVEESTSDKKFVAVNNQWERTDITQFIEHAQRHGFEITTA